MGSFMITIIASFLLFLFLISYFLYHLILLNCALFRLLRPYFLPSFLNKMWNTWLNNLLHHIDEWMCLLFMITFLLMKKNKNLDSNNERTNWSIMNHRQYKWAKVMGDFGIENVSEVLCIQARCTNEILVIVLQTMRTM